MNQRKISIYSKDEINRHKTTKNSEKLMNLYEQKSNQSCAY